MKKHNMWLIILLIAVFLIAAVIYIAGRTGFIGETAMMLILLPLMLGMIVLTCLIYFGSTGDKK